MLKCSLGELRIPTLLRCFLLTVVLGIVSACGVEQPKVTQRYVDTKVEEGMCVVVIGSSTAAGAGPERRDSAWAFRLRRYMERRNPRNRVVNLARGGYTSFHLLPDGDKAFAGNRYLKPDVSRNITKALEFQPDLIVMNLPSNDNTRRVPVDVQLANLKRIVERAEVSNVPIWVSTTQPVSRNLKYRELQLMVRDSISALFKPRVIDFWNGLADVDGRILRNVSSGDGVHLNSNGHRLLFDRVLSAVPIDSLYRAKQDYFGLSAAY